MKTLQKALALSLLCAALALSLFGCEKPTGGGAPTVKLGAILPLTGSASENGEFQQQGINLAVEELNQVGGIKGQRVEVVYGDSKNDAREGITLFTRFSDADKLPVVICTMSGVSAPLTSYVAGLSQHNSVLFATVASAPGLAKKSEWVFRSFVTSDIEAAKTADFAFRQARARKMAIIYVNDDYGLGGYDVFKSEFEKLGGQVVFAQPFEKGATDFRTMVLRMKSENPDGIYVVGYDKSYATVIKQIGEAQVKAKLFTTVSLSVPSWLELAGGAAEGAYLTVSMFGADPNDPATRKFVEAYRQKYQREPNYVSAVTYSIVRMIAAAAENRGYTAEGVRQGLTEIRDFPSLVGSVTINADREGTLPVTIQRIEGGKVVALAGEATAAR